MLGHDSTVYYFFLFPPRSCRGYDFLLNLHAHKRIFGQLWRENSRLSFCLGEQILSRQDSGLHVYPLVQICCGSAPQLFDTRLLYDFEW